MAAEFHPAVYCLNPAEAGSLPAEEAETSHLAAEAFHPVEAVAFHLEAEAVNRPAVEELCHLEEEEASFHPVAEGCRLAVVQPHRHREAAAAALFRPVAAEAEHFRPAVEEEVAGAEHPVEAEAAARFAPGRFPRQRHPLSLLPKPVRMRRDQSWPAPLHRYLMFRYPIRPFRPSW